MGQLVDISQEDQWQVENLSQPKGPKQSNHQRESQSSDTRRDCACSHRSYEILQS